MCFFAYLIFHQRRFSKEFHSCLFKEKQLQYAFLVLFRIGLFGAAHGWGEQKGPPIPNICHTYPTKMKLGTVIPYLKKIQKIYESRDTLLEFCWHQHFSLEISKFCCIRKYKQIAFWYIISNSFDFFRVFKGFFDNHGHNFDDVSKIGYFRSS